MGKMLVDIGLAIISLATIATVLNSKNTSSILVHGTAGAANLLKVAEGR